MKALILSISLLFSLSIGGQNSDNELNKFTPFIQALYGFYNNIPQEKVYLHFDNGGYFIGETIWFKAYVVTAEQILPTDLSRILYVELLSPQGEIKETKKLKIVNGQCHGELSLKANMLSGFYEIRAYTRYMLNFDEDCIFSRVIPIYRRPEIDGYYDTKDMQEPSDAVNYLENRRKKIKKTGKVNISFFPEGGNLVNGLTSKVAFKVSGETGNNLDVEGAVCDESGNESLGFSSIHNGMGAFEFTPSVNKQQVKISFQGKKYMFDLPASLNAGYVMNVYKQNQESIFILLQKSENLTSDTLGLVVTCRGKTCFFEVVAPFEENVSMRIACDNLPEGVNCLTLFDSKGEILSERMFFVHRPPECKLKITTTPGKPKPFEKINLGFQLTDKTGKPEEASFSLAVRDAATEINTPLQDNLYTNLLLGSELKGYVENPDYYFECDDRQHAAARDLLMLVQGWRKYEWKQTGRMEEPVIKHRVEENIMILGKILSQSGRKEKEGVKVTLKMYDKEGNQSTGSCITNKNGEYGFICDDFEGLRSIVLVSEENGKLLDSRITIDRHFAPDPRNYSFLDTMIIRKTHKSDYSLNDSTKINSISHLQKLSEVTVSQKRLRPDIVYDVEKDINYMLDMGQDCPSNVHEYMLWKDPRYGYDETTHKFSYQGTPGLDFFFKKQGIYTNRRANEGYHKAMFKDQIEETQQIIISTNGKLKQEIRKEHSIKENYTCLCKVSYKTNPRYQKGGIRDTNITGYSQVKEFYNPDYEKNPVVPGDFDYRRTLYWDPDVTTDREGKASVSFYNNSSCREIIIDAQGINKRGIFVNNK